MSIQMTNEDDAIRAERMTSKEDSEYVQADYRDFYNMVTIGPMSDPAERHARAFIGTAMKSYR